MGRRRRGMRLGYFERRSDVHGPRGPRPDPPSDASGWSGTEEASADGTSSTNSGSGMEEDSTADYERDARFRRWQNETDYFAEYGDDEL